MRVFLKTQNLSKCEFEFVKTLKLNLSASASSKNFHSMRVSASCEFFENLKFLRVRVRVQKSTRNLDRVQVRVQKIFKIECECECEFNFLDQKRVRVRVQTRVNSSFSTKMAIFKAKNLSELEFELALV